MDKHDGWKVYAPLKTNEWEITEPKWTPRADSLQKAGNSSKTIWYFKNIMYWYRYHVIIMCINRYLFVVAQVYMFLLWEWMQYQLQIKKSIKPVACLEGLHAKGYIVKHFLLKGTLEGYLKPKRVAMAFRFVCSCLFHVESFLLERTLNEDLYTYDIREWPTFRGELLFSGSVYPSRFPLCSENRLRQELQSKARFCLTAFISKGVTGAHGRRAGGLKPTNGEICPFQLGIFWGSVLNFQGPGE